MKTIQITLAILFIMLCTISFSKDDEPAPIVTSPVPIYVEQNPFDGYLAATGFTNRIIGGGASGFAEFGLSFKPLVKGTITAVTVKLPFANPNLRLTIWDKTGAGTILKTEYVNVTASDTEIIKSITPLQLTANTEYMISINTDRWYDHRNSTGQNVIYPFTVGDIKITGYAFISGAAQQIPNQFPLNVYKGDVSFKFIQN